jgi:hypothetical protein
MFLNSHIHIYISGGHMSVTQEEMTILKRAWNIENQGAKEWEWHEVGAVPGKLVKLVAKGYIIVVKRDKRLKYKLNDEKLNEILALIGESK